MSVALHMPSTRGTATLQISVMSPTVGNTKGGKGSTAAFESAVDAYASRVLERGSPPEACIDPSVGPYVASLLRCADLREPDNLEGLAEYDSLLELVEDQCSLSRGDAETSLRAIAEAVCTGVVPHEPYSLPNVMTPMNPYGNTGQSLSSFRAMNEAISDVPTNIDNDDDIEGSTADGRVGGDRNKYQDSDPFPTPMTEQTSMLTPYTPASATGPSPLKPDNLIPIDLLGALDNPSPQMSRTARMIEEHKIQHDEAFPPLGAPVPATVQSKKLARGGGGGKKSARAVKDNTLAATLFAPSRPSQYVTTLPNPPVNADAQHDSLPSSPDQSHNFVESVQDNHFYHQQIESAVEILLSMNTDVGEAAAREAAMMAAADFNIAQHILTSAISAPPVCRHILHDGCYRSDCQFSHDVKGHTCLFWLRGRCGKGTACRFLHGFNKKILGDIPSMSTNNTSSISSNHMAPAFPVFSPTSTGSGLGFSHSYSSFTTSSSSQESAFSRSYDNSSTASWGVPGQSESPPFPAPGSFANIASQGYDQSSKFVSRPARSSSISEGTKTVPTVKIPKELWNPHENRDASAFRIPDPLERYHKVSTRVQRNDVIDLHFQSTKTFSHVLAKILPEKLLSCPEVWIVTGTGHHVGSRTHQKGGGSLEKAVMVWLQGQGYNYSRGRDRNSLGGALLVKQQ